MAGREAWEFIKMHGLGNDYLFFDAFEHADDLPPPEIVRAASDRHTGIGSDGVIVLLPSRVADLRMRIWNADASEAEMCGNGLRCLVKLAYERGRVRRDAPSCRVETGAGVLEAWPVWQGERVVACREEMGVPRLLWQAGDDAAERTIAWRRPGDRDERSHGATAVSMGNPHMVLFTGAGDDAPEVLADGPVLEHHALFPERVNVGFARIAGPEDVALAVWERGSGATRACGTGAAACLAAGIATGRLPRRARIALPGGTLIAEWPEEGASVYLTGPAESVGLCRFEPA
jgi:diaminopimelate epimerase